MHYTLLAPEDNSRNIRTGADAGPLIAAAQGWERVSEEMCAEVAKPFEEMLKTLQEQWSSPSANRMTEAAEPFRKWLQNLIDQLRETHEQTWCLWDAYNAARGDMVRLETIELNRIRRNLAIQNDRFGIGVNNALIARFEEEYMEFYYENVKVMRTYDTAVDNTLTKMTKMTWEPPPPITIETKLAPRATAV